MQYFLFPLWIGEAQSTSLLIEGSTCWTFLLLAVVTLDKCNRKELIEACTAALPVHFALFEPACKRFELHTFIWNHSKAVVLALSDKGDIFCCPQPLRVVSRKALAVCKVWLPTRSWGKLSTMLTNFDMCPSNSATLRMQCKQLQTMMLWSPSKYTQTKTHEHTQTHLRKKWY